MMKHKLFTLFVAVLASIGTSNAVKIGSLYYSLNNTDKTANVIKPEDGTVYDLVNVSIPSYIDYANEGQESLHYSVVGVARYAFEDCTSLTSLTLPNTIQGLGDEAFCRCTGLTSVTIPNSVTYMGWNVFSDCTNLTSVELGNSISSMGWSCFGGCTGLTSITIPSSLETIPPVAFADCSNLSSVTISEGVKTIDLRAFANCSSLSEITIPKSITKIEDSAFEGCSGLTSIVWNAQNCTSSCFFGSQVESFTFGNDVKSIPANCFFGMNKLTSITIPNSVTSIGNHAFRNCTGLTSIEIPNNVTSIGEYVFYDCTGLTSVTIGNSVTSIGWYAFANCSGLTSVTIPNSVTSIGGYAFSGCSGLTSIEIPNSVTSFGVYAFDGCSSLTSVTIGNSVTNIGSNAFFGCSGMTSVTIGNSITSIGEYAFAYCSNLTSITIPNSVTSIGEYAFAYCSNLTSITIPNSVTSIGGYAFYNVPNIVYSGSATGSPWGARSINGYVEGNLVYSDESKTNLLLCFPTATGAVTIPNSVTSIGNSVFSGCSGLTSVTIPNSITSIGSSAFYDCSGLTSIVWNVKNYSDFSSYSSSPFYNIRSKITSFTFGDEVEHIPAYLCYQMSNITSVNIPNSVTSIGKNAFYGCKSLTSVTIPNSITSIGSSAFYGCSGLTSIVWNVKNYSDFSSYSSSPFYNIRSKITSFTFGDEVEHIPAYLCYQMSNITSVTIPSSVTSIGEKAFYSCSNLTSLHNYSDIPQTISSNVFTSVPKSTCILYVPKESIEAYKSADVWKSFINIRAIGGSIYYTVTFVDWDETVLKSEQVEEGHAATAPADPVREGYTFIGWDKEFSSITSDLKVTAQYEENIPEPVYYTVTFVDWDETVLKSEQVEEGQSATAPADPVREGYTFIGWDKEFSNITSDLKVTAQYEQNIPEPVYYTVTFVDWDETVLKSEQVEEGHAATAPANPVREGYTFIGWDKDYSEITADLTVTAQYEKNVPEPENEVTRDTLDLSVDGITLDGWTIIDGTINEANTDTSKKKYSFDIKAGVPGIAYVTSKPDIQFQITNASDKTNAFLIYPGRCYEFGGKNGIIHILGTAKGDTIKITVAAKGSTAGNFLDANGVYPKNATALTEDLTLPAKNNGAAGADSNGYVWRTLEYMSNGGDVDLKEVSGGFRIKLIEMIHVKNSTPTAIGTVSSTYIESRKIFHNGQILIFRGDKVYTITGQEVR